MTSFDPALRPCQFCAETIRPGAVICRFCNHRALTECHHLVQVGKRYATGVTLHQQPAIWDTGTGGGPVFRFPDTIHGQQECNFAFQRFNTVEETVEPVNSSANEGLYRLAVLVVFLIIIYLGFHIYLYRNCLVQSPGIFSWPSSCF